MTVAPSWSVVDSQLHCGTLMPYQTGATIPLASVDSSPCQQQKTERSELERYLLPLLRCHPDVVSAWRSAESTGRYFNAAIKGSYDCRAAQSNEALGFK